MTIVARTFATFAEGFALSYADEISGETYFATFATAEHATLALGTWDALQPLDRFAIGLPDYPDRSATLIVEMPALHPQGARLTGPGIATQTHLQLPDVAAFQANRLLFPLGLDFFFTAQDRVAGLPRTTKVEAH